MRTTLTSVFVLIALLLCGAAARADDTYAPLIGNWTCSTDSGSVVNQSFTLTGSGRWLRMFASWKNSGQRASGYFDNYFYRDPLSGWWNTASYGANGWSWAGRSPGWNNDALIFDGVEETSKGPINTRETFTRTNDGKLEHTWQMQQGDGTYTITSRANCTKTSG